MAITEFPPLGEPQTFVELLSANSPNSDDRVAYRERAGNGWNTLTFGELRQEAHGIAAGLHALGVTPGDRVAIIMQNSVDWVRLFFGIVSAGAVAVPIYYALKPDEVATMLGHSEPVAAVVSEDTFDLLGDYLPSLKSVVLSGPEETVAAIREKAKQAREIVPIEELSDKATDESKAAVENLKVDRDDLAGLIFTSGTSGGHKGVMLTHRNLMANVAQSRRLIPFGPKDRLLLVLPLHHAFPFMIALGLLPALGAEAVFENDLRRIRDRMQQVKPTLFLGVPALYDMMYRNVLQGIEAQGKTKSFERGLQIAGLVKKVTGLNIGGLLFKELHGRLGGRLKLMVSGGAALNPDVQRNFMKLGLPIIQGWGLSESSPALALQKYSPWRFRFTRYYEKRTGSIGKALPGVEVQLRDVPDKGLYVSAHGEGELIARGANVTSGYWRAPELTEQIKDGDWLKTGDLGTIDREGNIRITGRSKFIIVLDSGEKVYPDELEERFAQIAPIADIAVRGVDVRGKQQVCAVVYPDRDMTLKALGERSPSAKNVREVILASVREEEKDVATFKRIIEIDLTDEPLPRTALRKVMRGNLQDTYSFDPDRWAVTWSERGEEGTP